MAMLEQTLPLPPNSSNNQKEVRYVVEGDCWICVSHHKDKDGYPFVQRKMPDGTVHRKLHRFVFHVYHGPINEGNFILHSCDNPSCVNPTHLSQGTHQDNMDDRHERGGYVINGKSRLSEEQVLAIYQLAHSSTLTMKAIGAKYGVSVGCVADIKQRRSYKRVLEESTWTI